MLNRWHSHTIQALANRGQPPNEVWYWAAEQVTLYSQTGVVKHTFSGGRGKIRYADTVLISIPDTLRGTPITGVSVPSSVTSIGTYSFYNCALLISAELPDTMSAIDANAFRGCSALALASLPSALETVGQNGFYGCSALALAELPSALASTGLNSFYGCLGLTQITFLGTPTSIGLTTFRGCTNLASIRVPWAEGAVYGAPWGATAATISYNYTPQ